MPMQKTGRKRDILHKTHQSLSFNQKNRILFLLLQQKYNDIGKKATLWKIIWNPTWAFFLNPISKLDFCDGFILVDLCTQTANIHFLNTRN
jgi:hypothetical protein